MREKKHSISHRISDLVVHFAEGNNTKFAAAIGTSEANIRNYINGTAPKFDIIASIAETFEISYEWLLLGKGSMLIPTRRVSEPDLLYATPETAPRGAVPYWDLPVSAGHSVVDIIGEKEPVGYIHNLPGIELAEAILPVSGMSMEPEISNGAIIGVRKMNSWETLNTERIYLIITQEDRMIKRISHDKEDSTILWCHSPNYPEFKIYKDDIIEVHRVCFIYNIK